LESKDHVPHALTGNDLVSAPPPHANGNIVDRPGTPPAEPPTDPNAGSWTSVAFILVLVAVLYFLKFDLGAMIKTVLGLAFVVFIHELGHFLAAKSCDVNVTTFSIGFGPAIWARKWGETVYQLAAIPLGGYVQMVGQVDGDEAADGSDNDPRSFRNKGVGQRMLIISAGVIMNVILALVAFILVFMIPGKMRNPAIVGSIDTGAPSFVEGLRTGAVFVRTGTVENPYFEDLKFVVALSKSNTPIPFDLKTTDGKVQSVIMEPRRTKDDPNPVVGIAIPRQLTLAGKNRVEKEDKSPAFKGSPAAAANFEFDDEIVGTSDPDSPGTIKALPMDPRAPGLNRPDFFEFSRRMQLLADKDVKIRVKRKQSSGAENVDLTVAPAWRRSLGMRMGMGQIAALRKNSPATEAKLQTPVTGDETKPSREGDRIDRVMVFADGGKKLIVRDNEPKPPTKEKLAEMLELKADTVPEVEHRPLDPDRLPAELKKWAASAGKDKKVWLGLRRHREQPGQQYDEVVVAVRWDDDYTFDRQLPMAPSSPHAIPELGFGYRVTTTVEAIDTKLKDHPLKPGDVVLNIKVFTDETPNGGKWMENDVREDQWAHLNSVVSESPSAITKLQLKVKRDNEERVVDLVPVADDIPRTERGWILLEDSRIQKADSVGEAISMGFADTHKSMLQVFLGIRGMVTGRINFLKNIGGPLSIAGISYRVAGFDTWEFVFFLGLISINLAVINFLPIPVLDGGHMVFLIYEKIRGKPASEGVRVGLTYVGLVLILSLMVFVIAIDFSKWFM